MEKTTLYLSPDIQAGLRDASRRLGKPQAQIVRDAVEQYLSNLPDSFPTSIGSFSDPTLDASKLEELIDEEWGGRDHPR